MCAAFLFTFETFSCFYGPALLLKRDISALDRLLPSSFPATHMHTHIHEYRVAAPGRAPQSALWKESDASILSAYELKGSVEVVSEEIRLCRHSECDAFGLPHVLRLVSRDGACIIWGA